MFWVKAWYQDAWGVWLQYWKMAWIGPSTNPFSSGPHTVGYSEEFVRSGQGPSGQMVSTLPNWRPLCAEKQQNEDRIFALLDETKMALSRKVIPLNASRYAEHFGVPYEITRQHVCPACGVRGIEGQATCLNRACGYVSELEYHQ